MYHFHFGSRPRRRSPSRERTKAFRPLLRKPIPRRFRCPEGSEGGWGVSEALEAFVASSAGGSVAWAWHRRAGGAMSDAVHWAERIMEEIDRGVDIERFSPP